MPFFTRVCIHRVFFGLGSWRFRVVALLAILALMAGTATAHAQPVTFQLSDTENIVFPAAPQTKQDEEHSMAWLQTPDYTLWATRIPQPWFLRVLAFFSGDNYLDALMASDCFFNGLYNSFTRNMVGKRFGNYVLEDFDFSLGTLGAFHTFDADITATLANDQKSPAQGSARALVIGRDIFVYGVIWPKKSEKSPNAADEFLRKFHTSRVPTPSSLTTADKVGRLNNLVLGVIAVGLILIIGLPVGLIVLIWRIFFRPRAVRPLPRSI